MITKTFQLDENYSILIQRDDFEKRLYLQDNQLKKWELIGTLKSQKWEFESTGNKLFKLAKQYPSQFINNIFKPMDMDHEITFSKQYKCFKRRINVTVGRTMNKIKNII